MEAIQGVDAIYLASAGIGIVAAAEIDGRSLKAQDHPILSLMPRG
jgi:hypothetical protein